MKSHDLLTEESAEDGFSIFAVMWAIAILFHLYSNFQPTSPLTMIIATILGMAAIMMFMQPSSLTVFFLMIGLQLVNVLIEAPIVTNHWLVIFLVNITILTAVILLLFQKQPVTQARLFVTFASPVRLVFIIFYSFAAFSKWNRDFFNPEVSCALMLAQDLFGWLQIKSLLNYEWVRQSVILGTVIIESSIPILLVFRKTRFAGIFLGLIFHGFLAIDPVRHFFDFSAMLFALFFLFMPLSFFTWAKQKWLVEWHKSASNTLFLQRLLVIVLGILLLCRLLYDRTLIWLVTLVVGRELLWLFYFGIIVWLFWGYVRQKDARNQPLLHPFSLAHPVLLVLPLLALLNGFTPHLGIKNGYAYNMYSNLRTEGGVNNHYIIQESLHLLEFQDDLVAVISSSDEALVRYKERGLLLTYFAFHDYLWQHPETAVTYSRNGTIYTVARVADDPELSLPLPLWQRKLLLFRPVDSQPVSRCLLEWDDAH